MQLVTVAQNETVDVILRDGSTLRLSEPVQADRQALVRFYEQLSDRSLYLRFHGHTTVDERLVDPVLDPDWIDRGALIGSVTEAGEERVVALGELRAAPRPVGGRGCLHRRGHASGPRDRNPPRRAARGPRRRPRDRALHR